MIVPIQDIRNVVRHIRVADTMPAPILANESRGSHRWTTRHEIRAVQGMRSTRVALLHAVPSYLLDTAMLYRSAASQIGGAIKWAVVVLRMTVLDSQCLPNLCNLAITMLNRTQRA